MQVSGTIESLDTLPDNEIPVNQNLTDYENSLIRQMPLETHIRPRYPVEDQEILR